MILRFDATRIVGPYPWGFTVYMRAAPHPSGKSYWSRPIYYEQRRRALPVEVREVLAWCDDQFGRPSRNRWTYAFAASSIRFRNEADAAIFKIRFC